MGLTVVQASLKLSTFVLACWVLGLQVCIPTAVPGARSCPRVFCAAFLEILVVYNLVGYVGAMAFYWGWRMISLSSEGK